MIFFSVKRKTITYFLFYGKCKLMYYQLFKLLLNFLWKLVSKYCKGSQKKKIKKDILLIPMNVNIQKFVIILMNVAIIILCEFRKYKLKLSSI